MAFITKERTFDLPDLSAGDYPDLRIRYDRDSDTMIVHLYGPERFGVNIPYENDSRLYIRLDRATDEIVGMMAESFLHSVVPEFPELLDTLPALGLSEDEIATVRARVPKDQQMRSTLARITPLFSGPVARYAV